MSNKTVKEFAEMISIPLDDFLQLLKQSGIKNILPDDLISDEERDKLMAQVRGNATPGKSPTLSRMKKTTLKQSVSASGGVSAKIKMVDVQIKKSKIDLKPKIPKITTKPTAKPTPTKKTANKKTPTKKQDKAVETPEVSTKVVPVSAVSQRKKAELEADIEKNAEKVRKQAAAKQQQTLHKKKQPGTAKPTTKSRPKRIRGSSSMPSPIAAKKARAKKGKQKKIQLAANLEAKHQFEKPAAIIAQDVAIPETIMVAELAQRMSIKAGKAIKELIKLGMMVTINQTIDQATAAILVEEMGHNPILQNDYDIEKEMLADVTSSTDDTRKTSARAPIVTVMGHVDHGKTSLIDFIRKTRVAAGESGGITQHIGAYQVKTDHGNVTFLDTPGHAAFTAMRARGAEITDIVIIVVACDDGVMPQTKEAIKHAKIAKVPIVVAVNKMDKPGASADKVIQEMAALEVTPEDWGGDSPFLEISAKTGQGIDALIEALILQAEILELQAPAIGAATGFVIESRLDRGRGPVATVLVQKGTLQKGQIILCGHEYGRIRAMFNENGKAVTSAGPSVPVEVLGLSGMPDAGEEFIFARNEKAARELAVHRGERNKSSKHIAQQAAKLDNVFSKMEASDKVAILNIIIKTDVYGSLEALRDALLALSTDEVAVKCIYGGIGGINENDANLAGTSGAILIGFNVRADASANKLIQEKGLDLHYYSIIHEAIDEIKRALSGMLAPQIQEKIVGLAQVRDVFKSPKLGDIAGCMVTEGTVKRNLPIRVLRDNVVIYEGQLESLRRFKDDVGEVKMGTECGIGVKNYNDVRADDQIEVFERIQVSREL